jgi:GTPase SAR1 family protein
METEYDYLFKIVLIGDAGVGKTSIVRRYTDGIFTSAGIPTIGVDFCIKTLQIGSSAVKVKLEVDGLLTTFSLL